MAVFEPFRDDFREPRMFHPDFNRVRHQIKKLEVIAVGYRSLHREGFQLNGGTSKPGFRNRRSRMGIGDALVGLGIEQGDLDVA